MIASSTYLQAVAERCRSLAANTPSAAARRLISLADKLESMQHEQNTTGGQSKQSGAPPFFPQ